MQSFSFDNESIAPHDPDSEEALFDSEVIQEDHELYYIHHYIDSMD